MTALFDPNVPVDRMAEVLAATQPDVDPKAGAAKRSIRNEKRGKTGYKDVPHSVYFYYLRVNRNGRLEVSHYFYPKVDPKVPGKWLPIEHTKEELEKIIKMLAENARPIKKPKEEGEQKRVRNPAKDRYRFFKGIEWKHKSYVVFFLDELNWKFHKPPKSDPVVFITEEKDGKKGRPNWSFFDAMDFEIDMPVTGSEKTDKRSALAFINHMKASDAGRDVGRDSKGKPLPGPWPTETQPFQFQMYLEAYFADGLSKMTVILDPDGNNMGPPIGPP